MSWIWWEKKNFLNNFSASGITDKTFWKTVKPLFTDKVHTKPKITLIVSREWQEQIVSEKVISEDQEVTEIFHQFLINTVLNVSTNP